MKIQTELVISNQAIQFWALIVLWQGANMTALHKSYSSYVLCLTASKTSSHPELCFQTYLYLSCFLSLQTEKCQ